MPGVFAWIFKYNYDSQALTAFGYPFSLAFEWRAWRQLRRRIFAGEFDVVLRIVPMTAVLPSPFAFFLRKGPIPFVIGPLNGGLPWPQGFGQPITKRNGSPTCGICIDICLSLVPPIATRQPSSPLRPKRMPSLPRIATNYFFVPENGVSHSLCSDDPRSPEPDAKLELIFVGG